MTQLAPAKADVVTSFNRDWIPGSYMGKADSPYVNECTSGPWLLSITGPYEGDYFMALPGHCVYAGPSSVSPRSNYAKFYKRNLHGDGQTDYFTDANGSIHRPSGSQWQYDIVLIGPASIYPASPYVMDYCKANSGGATCTGPNGSGTDWITGVAGGPISPNGISNFRPALGWEITAGIQSPFDDVIGWNVCMSGIRMGTNCGLTYGKITVVSNTGGSQNWETPAYKTDLDENRCGVRGGDSSAPVWLDTEPEVTNGPRLAGVGGVLLGTTDHVNDYEPACYGTGIFPTVGFDAAWIGIDDIRAAFPTYDLRFVNHFDPIDECLC